MIEYPNVKINIGLNIIRKREDGYHDIKTLFVPYFGIKDELEIITGDDFSRTSAKLFSIYGQQYYNGTPCLVQKISSDGKIMITIARRQGVDWDALSDLSVKAYQVLDKDFSLPPVKIFLEKLSPVGAGLGGGSSDAAFALKMFNQLFSLNLSKERLIEYAAGLGSDCPFFIYNIPMIGEGRGEKLKPYKLDNIDFGDNKKPCKYEIKLIIPEQISVSTSQAYKGVKPKVPAKDIEEILSLPISDWNRNLYNDFEETVFTSYPDLKKIKSSLYDTGAIYAAMSGSGSAIFAIYEN